MKKVIDKLKTLNKFLLNSKYHLGLEDILKEDKPKIENILFGKEKLSEDILKEIAGISHFPMLANIFTIKIFMKGFLF